MSSIIRKYPFYRETPFAVASTKSSEQAGRTEAEKYIAKIDETTPSTAQADIGKFTNIKLETLSEGQLVTFSDGAKNFKAFIADRSAANPTKSSDLNYFKDLFEDKMFTRTTSSSSSATPFRSNSPPSTKTFSQSTPITVSRALIQQDPPPEEQAKQDSLEQVRIQGLQEEIEKLKNQVQHYEKLFEPDFS